MKQESQDNVMVRGLDLKQGDASLKLCLVTKFIWYSWVRLYLSTKLGDENQVKQPRKRLMHRINNDISLHTLGF